MLPDKPVPLLLKKVHLFLEIAHRRVDFFDALLDVGVVMGEQLPGFLSARCVGSIPIEWAVGRFLQEDLL